MKAAILIDGGYFLKRLGSVRRDVDMLNAEAVDKAIGQLVDSHLKQLNNVEKAGNPYSLLYRCFFYDALPYMEKGHLPISGKAIDYAKSEQAKFRLALFDLLRRRANFAVRLGQVRKERSWILSEDAQKAILSGKRTPADLKDEDFYPGLRQKAVDMRIGVANNAEIDVIWDRMQPGVEEALDFLNDQLRGHDVPFKVETGGRSGKKIDFRATGTEQLPSGEVVASGRLLEWEVPREAPHDWPFGAKECLPKFWHYRIARQREIDASIAAKAEFEYLYDKPFDDKSKVRVAGPFTVESLSPHRTLAVDWDDELIDTFEAAEGKRKAAEGPRDFTDFAHMILENLKAAGVQQAHKEDRITFTSLKGWPGNWIAAEGTFMEGEVQRRAGVFIGPEFGTVSRPDLVAAAREAGDAGLSFHKLDRAKDTNFCSVRVNADIRIIVHRTASSILLVYVDHHDDAYKWAERRKIERHPTTGAMQLVEVRERVEEVEIFKPREGNEVLAPVSQPKPPLFENLRKFELMAFGVPEEWVNDVRLATEDTLFDIIQHLPQEAQEALLKLAVGEKPQPPAPVPVEADPFAHPDAQRRFRILTNAEELRQALDYPWDKWAVFLHPAQADLVERSFTGPARVSGSAGTGKTIVALHRAVHLARSNPGARVLLTTFSKPLANALSDKLARLVSGEPQVASRIVVKAVTSVGYDLYSKQFGQPQIASTTLITSLLVKSAAEVQGHKFSTQFLMGEWNDVVDAWQLRSWEDYRDVSRLGRKTRIGGKQRETLWAIFERVRAGLRERGFVTWSDVFGCLADGFVKGDARPYEFAVIDEAQDLGVAEARFFAALSAGRVDGLFFAGDIGQRIFQQPFSWKALGLDVRGRSSTLRINYRTSHQIRSHADRLLPATVADVDGLSEGRRGTVSMFDGPPPVITVCTNESEECGLVSSWVKDRLKEGQVAREIGIFVRSEAELRRARAAAKAAGVRAVELSEKVEVDHQAVSIGTMHFAKGLEFRSVAVMACDDDVMPQSARIEAVADEADLEEVYNTERHLLYVACTRARDNLLVSAVKPVSEFVDDLLKLN